MDLGSKRMKTLTRQEEQILLAIYHLDEKAYLVNIREKLREMTGKTLDVGTINKPLKRLSMQGYLSAAMGDPTPVRGGKSIKYYALTEMAFDALEDVKATHDRMWQNVVFPVKRV
jgi:DNA-binding PadR family transcriptional regulator